MDKEIYGEIFAIFNPDAEGPSVQAIEIIRHIDASFYRKKYRWDYQENLHKIRLSSRIRLAHKKKSRHPEGCGSYSANKG